MTESTSLAWLRVALLALGAFVFNTTEFVPVGMLENLGQSFDMSATEIGPMLTIYAWVVALASLPAMLIFAKVERKFLLLGVLAVFTVSHLLSYFATSYVMLLASRIGIAFAHSIFWAITAAMVVRVAPKGQATKALGILATGSVLAMVFGIPLGRVIGDLVGWRVTFALIGVIALMLFVAIWALFPKLMADNGGDSKSLPMIFNNKPLLWLYLLTVIAVTAHFTGYTYLEPLIQQAWQYSEQTTTITLFTYGILGLLGSFLFSKFQPVAPNQLLMAGVMFIGVCLLMISLTQPSLLGLLILAGVWGCGMMIIPLTLQARVLVYSSQATDIAMAIFSGIFNVGIGAGALIGSIIAGGYGVEYNGFVAIGILVFALVPLRYLFKTPLPSLNDNQQMPLSH